MEFVKVNEKMNQELSARHDFSMERINYLTYTKNFYYLTKDDEVLMTDEAVTLPQLQFKMELNEWAAATLDPEQAEKALDIATTPKPRKQATRKTASQKKKEEEQEKKRTEETAKKENDKKSTEDNG